MTELGWFTSTLWTTCRKKPARRSTRRTPCTRKNTETGPVLRMSSSAKGNFNMKRWGVLFAVTAFPVNSFSVATSLWRLSLNWHERNFDSDEDFSTVVKWCFGQEVKANPHNYDAWFDYLRLLESDGDVDQVREVYERAIANVPPSKVSVKMGQQ